jgi:hypothetical protein
MEDTRCFHAMGQLDSWLVRGPHQAARMGSAAGLLLLLLLLRGGLQRQLLRKVVLLLLLLRVVRDHGDDVRGEGGGSPCSSSSSSSCSCSCCCHASSRERDGGVRLATRVPRGGGALVRGLVSRRHLKSAAKFKSGGVANKARGVLFFRCFFLLLPQT